MKTFLIGEEIDIMDLIKLLSDQAYEDVTTVSFTIDKPLICLNFEKSNNVTQEKKKKI
jgi:hypothetical protein